VLEEEWKMRHCSEPIGTVFFGGGTPSLLSCSAFHKIRQFLPIDPKILVEWTVECNPSTLSLEKLQTFADIGVTRISLGVQSFSEKFLGILGRRQSAAQIFHAYDMLRKFSFDVNLDLIFSIPGQRLRHWEEDLKTAVQLGPDHISAYHLTLEKGTKFTEKYATRVGSGERFHRLAVSYLVSSGMEHYEVSNFAKKGKRCIHSVNTWRMGEWLAIGPSGASQYRGRRFQNISNLEKWMDGIFQKNPIEVEVQAIDQSTLLEDTIIFGLRMRDGIPLATMDLMECSKSQKYRCKFSQWCDAGLLKKTATHYALTDRGMLLADALALEIL
jgi:oxygen-independent coproporphyrinogen-3 oxidase